MNEVKIPKPAEAQDGGEIPSPLNGDFDCPKAAASRSCPCGFCRALRTQPGACKSRVEQVAQEVLAEHEGDEAFDFLKAVVGKIVTRVTE